MAGIKHDIGKSQIGLLPRYPLEQAGLAMAYGAQKYGRHNWRLGISVQRNLDAALRHILAANEREDLDPESGLPHLAHALCCIMFAFDTIHHGVPGLDDRSPEMTSESPADIWEGSCFDTTAPHQSVSPPPTNPPGSIVGRRVVITEADKYTRSSYSEATLVGLAGTVRSDDLRENGRYKFGVKFDRDCPPFHDGPGDDEGRWWWFTNVPGETDGITVDFAPDKDNVVGRRVVVTGIGRVSAPMYGVVHSFSPGGTMPFEVKFDKCHPGLHHSRDLTDYGERYWWFTEIPSEALGVDFV